MLFDFNKEETNIFGLKFKPTTSFDNDDWYQFGNINGNVVDMNYKHDNIKIEFSHGNKEVLMNSINELKSKNQLNSILEIGVFRSGELSSTQVILDNKLNETKYFGIDLVENNLTPIRDHSKNIFCYCQNSSNIDKIMAFCKDKGVETFDMILIDGYHSIDQVIKDWRFVQYLNVGGIVLMHDTNYHPGPYCVFEAINEDLFEKQKFLTEEEFDWGISTARRTK